MDVVQNTLSPMLNTITNSKRGHEGQKLMLCSKHAGCITMYPSQRAYFTNHIEAPCSPETHRTGQFGGQKVDEGKGLVHVPNQKGASP